MKQATELYNLLKGLNDKGMGVVSVGEVKSVDKNRCTCIVVVDELDIENVRLKATMDDEKSFKMFPRLGSTVLIERIADGQFAVKMYSEVESVLWDVEKKYELHVNEANLVLDGKVELSNDREDLLTLLKDLINACINEKHQTNSGLSIGLNPASQAKFEQLKKRFSLLLK